MPTKHISFPTNNSNVPGNGTFAAYGTANPSNSTMTGWIMDGQTRYDGDPTDPPQGSYHWAFNFEDIPTGHQVTLYVQATSGGSSFTESVNITCVT